MRNSDICKSYAVMEVIVGYLAASLADAVIGMLMLFGGIGVLGVLLYHASNRLRSLGASAYGYGYFKFVALGVACHETGHALGCLVAYPFGVRISEYAPYHPRSDGVLGWVAWGCTKRLSPWLESMINVIVGTGPIWFGSMVVYLLSNIFYDMPDIVVPLEDGLLSNLMVVCMAAWDFVRAVFAGFLDSPLRSMLYIYIVFCVVSEMKLSSADMAGMGAGFVSFVLCVIVLNCIPVVDCLVAKGVLALLPFSVAMQIMMLAALALNLVFCEVFKVVINMRS